MKTKVMIFCITLTSWGAFAQHDHPQSGDEMKMKENTIKFKDDKLGKAYENYIELKNALVSSNQSDAAKSASILQKSLADVSGGKMVADEAEKVAIASTLEDQRKAFAGVSDMMAMLIKDEKLSNGMIYVEYCPMVKASWLSSEEEIKNPYFGDKMLTCGSVKEMIH